MADDRGTVGSRLSFLEQELKILDNDVDKLNSYQESALRQFSRKLGESKRAHRASQMEVDRRLDMMARQIDVLVTALNATGVTFPAPPSPDTTVPSPPPILLTPCTPANTQEAETYAQRPLQPPSLGSVPPIDAGKAPLAEEISAHLHGQPPADREDPVGVGEIEGGVATVVPAAGDISEANTAIQAGTVADAAQALDAGNVDQPGTTSEAGKAPEARIVDEADKGDTAVTPAAASPSEDIQPLSQPPPPPPSQSTLQPPPPLLPSPMSPRTPSHTPAPSLPAPHLSPLPGQTSRRSPRLQHPIVASPAKEKRPRPDDEGRGTSKRRKE